MYKEVNSVPTKYWNIHMAGDIQTAKTFTRDYTFKLGWCVQLYSCDYIYTGGLEAGIMARVISYPRFEKDFDTLDKEVYYYAMQLAEAMCQKSYTIENNKTSTYYESDNPLHKK